MNDCFVKKLRGVANDANLPYYGEICITISSNSDKMKFVLSNTDLGSLPIEGVCEGDCYFVTSGGTRIGTVLDESSNVVNECYVAGTGKVHLMHRYNAKMFNFPSNNDYSVDIEELIWAPNTISSIVGQGIVGDLSKINYTNLIKIELRNSNTFGDITDLVLNNINSIESIVARGNNIINVNRAFADGSTSMWNISSFGLIGDFAYCGKTPLERLYTCSYNTSLTGSMEEFVSNKLVKYPNTAGRLVISVPWWLGGVTYTGETISTLVNNGTIPTGSVPPYFVTMKWDAQGNITWENGDVNL